MFCLYSTIKMTHGAINIRYALFLSDFNQKFYFSIDFLKIHNIKFHEHAPNGSPVVPYGQTDTMKLTIAFRQFANAPKNRHKNSPELK